MSYSSVVEMAHSSSLIGRMIAAAAAEKVPDPEAWVRSQIWALASSPDWGTNWESANLARDPNVNPDTGIRTDVITDGNILAAVKAAQQPQL